MTYVSLLIRYLLTVEDLLEDLLTVENLRQGPGTTAPAGVNIAENCRRRKLPDLSGSGARGRPQADGAWPRSRCAAFDPLPDLAGLEKVARPDAGLAFTPPAGFTPRVDVTDGFDLRWIGDRVPRTYLDSTHGTHVNVDHGIASFIIRANGDRSLGSGRDMVHGALQRLASAKRPGRSRGIGAT